MNLHDASYRQLFNSPELVRELFEGIIDDPIVSELDWQNLQPLPSDYISKELRERQGDRVWRIPRRDGSLIYVLLMLEHQARSDYYMVLRILTYCGLLYQSLLQHGLISRKTPLPRILPVVLYSGVRPWRAPTTLAELFGSPALDPASEMLAARYVLVDEGELVRSGNLPDANLAALLFRLEHNQGIADAAQLLQTIWNSTQGAQYRELRRTIMSWMRYVLLPRALPHVALPEAESLLEIKNMLTEQSRSWTHQWKMEGREEGRQEGEATLLQRLLTRKFGILPEPLQQRIQTATSAQLETWSLNILDAATLDEVFAE